MGLTTGYYSINDLKQFFLNDFRVGNTIETIIRNGDRSLRLRYQIVYLSDFGAECRILEEEWIDSKHSYTNRFNLMDVRRFIASRNFKYFHVL